VKLIQGLAYVLLPLAIVISWGNGGNIYILLIISDSQKISNPLILKTWHSPHNLQIMGDFFLHST
jgi:hypothetical protein